MIFFFQSYSVAYIYLHLSYHFRTLLFIDSIKYTHINFGIGCVLTEWKAFGLHKYLYSVWKFVIDDV